ncbi:MAG: response regulator, partial [Caulobacteraceae bacterium]
EVAVRVDRGEGSERRLRVEVSDTGIGIGADQLSRVFDRFTQADVTVSRRFGGTGLGLAISKRFVELMGGELGVTSAEGAGSTFWFELNLPRAGRRSARPTAETVPTPPGRTLRLLLVEDVEVNRELVCALLSPFDIEIDTAANGLQAIEAVDAVAYDLVLMDVQMPVMDGLTASRRIRAAQGQAGRVPIIAMTANVLPDQIDRCLQAGMDDHLGKPIDPATLLEAIRRWTSEPADARDPASAAA